MPQATQRQIVLLLVFVFAFVYRLTLMLWNTFPSGADIGLHNSVIYSITGSGNVDFLYNYYHIGGGLSLTFPGYHIFTSAMILFTALPEYIAHAVVVSLFSSLLVLGSYLITRRVWNESTAVIVAFLVAISRFDLEMILWAGYPNVVTLLLIPLIFYLFLEKDRFTIVPFLASTSILIGSLYLTHSLSAGIFIGVTLATVLCIFIAPKTFATNRKTGLYWLLPVFVGAVLVAPFLIKAVPGYLTANSTFANTQSSQAIESALLATRILPYDLVVPLFGVLAALLVFSRYYNKRWLPLPMLIICVWLFVPLVLTQGYLVGFYIDYNRFLYYTVLPVMVFLGITFEHTSTFFAIIVKKIRDLTNLAPTPIVKKTANKTVTWLTKQLTPRNVYAALVAFFLLFSFFAIPVFMNPNRELSVGLAIGNFYQTMTQPGWDAIQWAKQNTAPGAIFVSDATYGWWFGGFAQRPTLSAVDPQYLSLDREFAPTQFARNLLDTDYLVDNGLVQVREDGGYLARHNPEILATLNNTYPPYSFFNFGSDQIEIVYSINNGSKPIVETVWLNQLTFKNMQIQNDTQQAVITVVRGNDYFNYSQITTVYKGSRFVNLTTSLDSTLPEVSLILVRLSVQTKGIEIQYSDKRTIGLLDVDMKTFGQLIFITEPAVAIVTRELPTIIDLEYNLQSENQSKFELYATAYSPSGDPDLYRNQDSINRYFPSLMSSNMQGETLQDLPFLQVFNYQNDLRVYNVSYVACRVAEMYPKFSNDPSFNLVFINKEVAIFKFHANHQ